MTNGSSKWIHMCRYIIAAFYLSVLASVVIVDRTFATQPALVPEQCESDFDSDGDVDGTDLGTFRVGFGRTDCSFSAPCSGDFDGDGDVDGTDLATFKNDFGRTDCLNPTTLLVNKDDPEAMALAETLVSTRRIDYLDSVLLVVDESELEEFTEAQRKKLTSSENFNELRLRNRNIATDRALPSVPSELTRTPTEGFQLALIQFVGPILSEWLDGVQALGPVTLLAHVDNHGYLIWTDGSTLRALEEEVSSSTYLSWVGPFQPADSLHPHLISDASAVPHDVRVMIYFVDHPAVSQSIDYVTSRAKQIIRSTRKRGNFIKLGVVLSSSDLIDIANMPDVANIEPLLPAVGSGERQAQLLLTSVGNPTTLIGPGYLDWPYGLGFRPPFDFVVDITDTGIDRGSTNANDLHPDFLDHNGKSRIAYVQEIRNQTINTTAARNNDTRGHGTINHAIIGGLNDTSDLPGTNTDFEDADGFQYGLGIAPFVKLGSSRVFARDLENSNPGFQNHNPEGFTDPDYTTLISNAYRLGARISNNSWGGPDCNPDPTSGRCRPRISEYEEASEEYDGLVRDARPSEAGNQEMTIVFAAGNLGQFGAGTLPNAGATAKNTIVVGASENINATGDADGGSLGNTDADNGGDIAQFSSRGPTSDGRFKPDLVAPGTHIFGAASQDPNYRGDGVGGGPDNHALLQPNEDRYYPPDNCNLGRSICLGITTPAQTLYTWSSGTSHAAPAVAGAAALLRQWFINENGKHTEDWSIDPLNPTPSPAMTKAWLLNSTTYITGNGATNDDLPSNNQGMGRLNLQRSFDRVSRVLVDQTHRFREKGDFYTVSVDICDPNQPFRVTLAWTDAVTGAVIPSVGGNLVNDLDLTVNIGAPGAAQLNRGNHFSRDQSITGGNRDSVNNVESVWLPVGTTGTATIVVKATELEGDGVPNDGDNMPNNDDLTDQDFALVIYNAQKATGSQTGCQPCSTADSPKFTGHCTRGTNVVVPTSCTYVYVRMTYDGTKIKPEQYGYKCVNGTWSLSWAHPPGGGGFYCPFPEAESCRPHVAEHWSDNCGGSSDAEAVCPSECSTADAAIFQGQCTSGVHTTLPNSCSYTYSWVTYDGTKIKPPGKKTYECRYGDWVLVEEVNPPSAGFYCPFPEYESCRPRVEGTWSDSCGGLSDKEEVCLR